jgi:hypothetical protein
VCSKPSYGLNLKVGDRSNRTAIRSHSGYDGAIRKTCVATLLKAFAYPLASNGQTYFPSTSGNAFVLLCSDIDKKPLDTTSSDYQHFAACIGYMEGFIDGISEEIAFAHSIMGKEPPGPFCLASEIENGQMIRVGLKYIGDHPEEAHYRTALLISLGLRDAFPCSAHPATSDRR